ncbi:4-(cytidine 5'-diphospho)-2-C-methyl-D-erythritol kinase [Olsenella sp. YH-ols2217]|uniref:4-diphosphocytidyl-2-C-methyl-D-erythritol kinase n=1 Tax=Kribbibacterium absianum TaxID=3044210 RepID=A0ABT6ZM49_9ACTN|nr:MULTISPECIES: 4-(cytidine 5'-diphospho)-2-C-methyl-D-erythritol kinase [unclassified Olsenella]MDJ1121605.1 4-(cytidine 5'-diphospho)-2-C-methyl-D-erythritol kinase [Olsenella sp. YH-ols2216]MDJ1129613.1 4-(cytidine 5'-diphospho)-2-C-methyl-D-erythritol kinase [Olsenella sp. YH-ols2217]
MGRLIRVTAPAKVNLYLGVSPRTERGKHLATSLMAGLSLHDTVTIQETKEPSLTCTPDAPCPQAQNLAWRAAEAMAETFRRRLKVSIVLDKRIPSEAGLGGGSSDAAAVIRGLCTLWGKDPLGPDAQEVARSLGADVPFFLTGGETLLLGGYGDVPERSFECPELAMALVRAPGPGAPTKECYRAFDEEPRQAAPLEPLVSALEALDAPAVIAATANNLTEAAERCCPAVGEAFAWLATQPRVVKPLLCGSGSCVAALCACDEDAAAVAAAARSQGWWSEAVRTL